MTQAAFAFMPRTLPVAEVARTITQTPRFDGPDVEPADAERLASQLERVRAILSDGEWYTLHQLYMLAGGSMQGISARLRDLRKQRFGAHQIERRRITGGLFEYRMVV